MKTSKYDVCISLQGAKEIWACNIKTPLRKDELIEIIRSGPNMDATIEIDEVLPADRLTSTPNGTWIMTEGNVTYGFKAKDIVCVRLIESISEEE